MVKIWQLIGGGPLATGGPSHGTTGTMDNPALGRDRGALASSCFERIIVIIITIIHAEIKVTLSQKCCRSTVQKAMSHVRSHSNCYNWRNRVRSAKCSELLSDLHHSCLDISLSSMVIHAVPRVRSQFFIKKILPKILGGSTIIESCNVADMGTSGKGSEIRGPCSSFFAKWFTEMQERLG